MWESSLTQVEVHCFFILFYYLFLSNKHIFGDSKIFSACKIYLGGFLPYFGLSGPYYWDFIFNRAYLKFSKFNRQKRAVWAMNSSHVRRSSLYVLLLLYHSYILPFSHLLFQKIAYNICHTHDKGFHGLFSLTLLPLPKIQYTSWIHICLPITLSLPSLSLCWITLRMCPSFRLGRKPTGASHEHIPAPCYRIKEFRK